MELDARKLEPGDRLDADVCIIGTGPAGTTLARELTGFRGSVLLLESGGLEADGGIQALNEGAVIGSPYQPLRATRHRQVGGTPHLWNTSINGIAGAKYAPLDQMDFERSDFPLSGWPFDRTTLDPFYTRAHRACGLGDFDYDSARWATADRPCLPAPDPTSLTTGVYHVGPAHWFTVAHPAEIRASEHIRLVHRATCCALLTDGARRVTGVVAKSDATKTFRVHAKTFVLAAGAVENARLLLASGDRGEALGNEHGWVGRCFMEHPRDYALRLVPRSSDVFREIAFYDLHRPRDESWILGRLALGESSLGSLGFANASVSLLPRPRRRPWVDAIGRMLPRLRRSATVGYGWSSREDVAERCDHLQVVVNLEQRPHPDNRIVLSSARDAFGMPRPEIRLQWRAEEQAALHRLRAFLADRLTSLGLGNVQISNEMLPDLSAHHHAGTTRMSVDPRWGVVDEDCRVHGTDNLYVAGSSVFPTAGFANPTLTIAALAIRLADCLEANA
jgi:choline dehydrogenase-like flavoprotein